MCSFIWTRFALAVDELIGIGTWNIVLSVEAIVQ